MKKEDIVGTEVLATHPDFVEPFRCFISQFDYEVGCTIKLLDPADGEMFANVQEDGSINLICINIEMSRYIYDVKASMTYIESCVREGRTIDSTVLKGHRIAVEYCDYGRQAPCAFE